MCVASAAARSLASLAMDHRTPLVTTRSAAVATLLLVLALPGAAHADRAAVVLRPDFAPNPLVIQHVESRLDLPAYEKPFKQCGSGLTSREPALTFELAAPLQKLEVRFIGRDAGAGLIVFPDGSYICDVQDPLASSAADADRLVYADSWPRGRYQVYRRVSSDRKQTASFDVRFEQPERTKQALAAAIKSAPTVALGAAKANPLRVSFTPKLTASATDVGPRRCFRGEQGVALVMRLELDHDIAALNIRSESFVLQKEGDDPAACTQWSAGSTDALAAGRYNVYVAVDRRAPPTAHTFELDDLARPLTFARTGEPTNLGDLAAPLVLAGKVRPSEPPPSRDDACGVRTPRDPDLYVVSREPLAAVKLTLLWSRHPQGLRIYGPIEKAPEASECTDSIPEWSTELMEGTYAIWVGDGDGHGVGDDFHLLVRRSKTKMDPLKLLVVPPAGLSVAERALANHYPFLGGYDLPLDTPFRLFTEAPTQLFVYPRADVEVEKAAADSPGPRKGEPLLVRRAEATETEVQTWEGDIFYVHNDLLVTAPPAPIAFPDRPRPVVAADIGRAVELSGPEDAPEIARFNKLWEAYTDCFDRYMRKHDPSWTIDADFYRIKFRNGEVVGVENTTDVATGRAEKSCGKAKTERAEQALMTLLAQRRAQRAAAHFAVVKKRFGS
jgi:hypothetical protein